MPEVTWTSLMFETASDAKLMRRYTMQAVCVPVGGAVPSDIDPRSVPYPSSWGGSMVWQFVTPMLDWSSWRHSSVQCGQA